MPNHFKSAQLTADGPSQPMATSKRNLLSTPNMALLKMSSSKHTMSLAIFCPFQLITWTLQPPHALNLPAVLYPPNPPHPLLPPKPSRHKPNPRHLRNPPTLQHLSRHAHSHRCPRKRSMFRSPLRRLRRQERAKRRLGHR